ncbi:MAG TPA: hypothetical protein VLK57_21200 [Pseudonocardia sp.]|nr:hypothetical protein [Pseudonocardia sp.]
MIGLACAPELVLATHFGGTPFTQESPSTGQVVGLHAESPAVLFRVPVEGQPRAVAVDPVDALETKVDAGFAYMHTARIAKLIEARGPCGGDR